MVLDGKVSQLGTFQDLVRVFRALAVKLDFLTLIRVIGPPSFELQKASPGPGKRQARASSRSRVARSRYSALARCNENECSSNMHAIVTGNGCTNVKF